MSGTSEAINDGSAKRTLGLIGGMSWESTAIYYRLLNEGVRMRCGGLQSAPLLVFSPDFAPIAARQAANDWTALELQLGAAGRQLAQSGAEAILVCSNTMHCLYEQIQAAAGLPVLHIADATGEALRRAACNRPALLGTRFTMEGTFYSTRLKSRFGIDTVVPDAASRAVIHRIIYEELCQGIVRDDSRRQYQQIIGALKDAGADSVILGCTEITMLIAPQDSVLPVFDTTDIHANAGVSWMLNCLP